MLAIGTIVDGKYKILNKIGHGGMSNVYLAMNEKANKTWAIKEVRKKETTDFDVIRQSLMVETDLLKKMKHPNLPSIIDVIDEDENFLIVMDYVEGNTLQTILEEREHMTQEEVVEIAIQLCEVLDYLHSKTPAIIYRDMKPSNIMLKSDNSVILIDFGTAREYKQEQLEDTTCLGTRGYAAPEQFGGMGQTDVRTDIYCLGATMYHLVTGHNPAKPPYEMYPIRQWNPHLSSGLEFIIEKCINANPEERFQSAKELSFALTHYREMDESVIRQYKNKIRLFQSMTLATIFCIFCACFFFAQGKKVQSREYYTVLQQAEKMVEKEEKIPQLIEAIGIDPTQSQAYDSLYEAVIADGIFDEYEERQLLYVNTSTQNYLQKYQDKNPIAYADFCYDFGNAYWYYYEHEESRQTHAVSWFASASPVYEQHKDKEQEYQRCVLYTEIGGFYKKILAAQIDGTDAGMYGTYWNRLVELKKENDENRDRDLITLRMYQEMITKSTEYARYLQEDGVTKQEIQALHVAIKEDLGQMEKHATNAVMEEIAGVEELIQKSDHMLDSSF